MWSMMYLNVRYINMETYTFWYETESGNKHAMINLSKRKATIEYNKLLKNYNPVIKRFGMMVEKNA